MRKKQFENLCKKLIVALPDFSCKGFLLFARPVGHVLRGFCCDDSGFDLNKFAVWVFFLPFYVPTKHLGFNIGQRLKDDRGCDKWWNINDPETPDDMLFRIRSQGIPFLSGVEEPLGLVQVADRRYADSKDPHVLEAIAYSLLISGHFAASKRALDTLLAVLSPAVGWQNEMKLRTEKLKALDSEAAQRILAQWEKESRTNLGISE